MLPVSHRTTDLKILTSERLTREPAYFFAPSVKYTGQATNLLHFWSKKQIRLGLALSLLVLCPVLPVGGMLQLLMAFDQRSGHTPGLSGSAQP